MTEDELLAGVTEALELSGWRWTHIINSRGVTMGDPGLPDIIAVHPIRGTILAWELKGDGGRPSGDQVAWLSALYAANRRADDCSGMAPILDARLLYPGDYDRALAFILGKTAYMADSPARRET